MKIIVIVNRILSKLVVQKELFLKVLLLTIVLIATTSCHNSGFNKPNERGERVNSKTIKKDEDNTQTIALLKLNKDAVRIIDFLPASYDTIASVDYTSIIQGVLNSHSIVEFPNFPILINEVGLNIRSNSSLIFPENSLLKFASSDKISYKVLNFTKVENVTLFSPKIEGDRYRRKFPNKEDGSWGMGISIRSSKNIVINDAKIMHCWGDGVYIGGCNQAPHNNSIIFNNLFVDNVRRNGVSITCGKHVYFNDAHIVNTQGTAPESGIDIEPNLPTNIIEDINLINPFTENNANHGIVVSLGQLVGTAEKEVSINIEDHVDKNSGWGFTYASFRKEKLDEFRSLSGNVIVNNPKYSGNKKAFLIGASKGLYPLITISNPMIYTIDDGQLVLDLESINTLKNEIFKSDLIIK
jgi:hypothetical protein